MAFLTIGEVLDIVVMSLVIGFIFMDYFRGIKPRRIKSYYELFKRPMFDRDAFIFSILVVVPAIVLHEFGHKLTAMLFGYTASFHAAYIYLLIGLFLKLIGSPIIFFVPAYVSIPANTAPLEQSLIALMGPGVNIMLWLLSFCMLENHADTREKKVLWAASKRINGFLAVFNLLPIPGFDGFHVIAGLIRAVA